MSDTLITLLCQIFLMLVGALAGRAFDRLKKAEDKRDALEAMVAKRQEAMENGLRMILKIELRRIHTEAMQRGTISYEDEAFAEEIYQRYHDLGGNGQATAMMEDIRGLLKGDKT